MRKETSVIDYQQRTPTEIVTGLIEDADRLVRLELELGTSEARELAVRNRMPMTLTAVGVAMGAIGLLAGVPALLIALLPWHWEVAAVWIVAYVIVAAILIPTGRSRLRLVPALTLRNVEETEQWLVRQVKSFER